VRPVAIILLDVADYPFTAFPDIAILFEIYLIILETTPKPLNYDIVQGPAFPPSMLILILSAISLLVKASLVSGHLDRC